MRDYDSDKPPPPCRRCGAEEGDEFITLTRHHIIPQRTDCRDPLVKDKVIILCRSCHDDVEKLIRHHERRYGKQNCRSELPKWMYIYLSLQFIT